MNMDTTGESVGAAPVRVGVVLIPDTELKGCVIREDGQTVDHTLGTKEETTSFSFDQAVTLEHLERVESGILNPLAEFISCGYNGTLLIGGIHRTGKTGSLVDEDIIKKLLQISFGHISKVKAETLSTVSFVQFYPDDSALDLLNAKRQDLKPFPHPVLGSLVEGLFEVPVCTAEESYQLYETGKRLADTAAPIASRCSYMFSVGFEWRLHSDQSEAEFCRGRLQLLSLAGGASKTDLRGVSPLVKVLDEIQLGTSTSNQLLPFILHNALTGNSRTSLLYCIRPHGLLDNETPSALALAHRVQGLVTKTTYGRWCPRATEEDIRFKIQRLRAIMMSQEDHIEQNTYKLAELTKVLQIVKDQSWEKKREVSEKIKEKLKGWQSTKNNWYPSGDQGTEYRETTGTMKYLQHQLRHEMKKHTREGKGSVEKVQERVAKIQHLRESLNNEMKNGIPLDEPDLSQPPMEYSGALERRRQVKEDHEKLIQEELEKMEAELKQEQEPAEGLQRELLVMAKERRVVALQMEVLRAEAMQAERDLQDQHRRHQQELQCLREESLTVFQVFYQVSMEQKKAMKGRYQALLLEAVQDAVFLSAQNQQLQAENKMHRTGELKDALATRSDAKAELSSPPQWKK